MMLMRYGYRFFWQKSAESLQNIAYQVEMNKSDDVFYILASRLSWGLTRGNE